jgi:hypothetical protein
MSKLVSVGGSEMRSAGISPQARVSQRLWVSSEVGRLAMGFTSRIIGVATCLLASSHFAPTTAQTALQGQLMKATASATTKSDACTASQDKAYGLCMARSLFNITGVSCDCSQRNVPGAPWECEGTATCNK